MRSMIAVLCLAVAARRVDAQDGGLLSGRVRLAVQPSVAAEEQRGIERAFRSAGWPLVTGHGPEDRATLMIFLSRTQPRDTTVGAFHWTVRIVDIGSGNIVYRVTCTAKGSGEMPSGLPARIRREMADGNSSREAPTAKGSCSTPE